MVSDKITLSIDKSVTAHGYTICYNDKAHKYWITYPDTYVDGTLVTGSQHMVYGMTTVQKPIGSVSFSKEGQVSSKTDTLMAWAVKVNREAMLEHVKSGKEMTVHDVEDLSKSYSKRSDYAKDFGHKVHSIIEAATGNSDYVWLDTPEHKVAKRVVMNDAQTNTHVIAQELLVFAPSNPQDPPSEWRDWIAGTFDRLVLRDGRVELQDHKTSSGVYDLNYYCQLMGYQFMLEWMMTDPENTYSDTLGVLKTSPIQARRVNLATKLGEFNDSWVSTSVDDMEYFKATLSIFNISKKYRHLFWN